MPCQTAVPRVCTGTAVMPPADAAPAVDVAAGLAVMSIPLMAPDGAAAGVSPPVPAPRAVVLAVPPAPEHAPRPTAARATPAADPKSRRRLVTGRRSGVFMGTSRAVDGGCGRALL